MGKTRPAFQGIATGYLGSIHQIDLVEDFLRRFDRPETIVLVDPVMGDYGALYPTYSQELAENVGRLLPYADILTPNLTEACILTGTDYRPDPDENELLTMCQQLSTRPQKSSHLRLGLWRSSWQLYFRGRKSASPAVCAQGRHLPQRNRRCICFDPDCGCCQRRNILILR